MIENLHLAKAEVHWQQCHHELLVTKSFCLNAQKDHQEHDGQLLSYTQVESVSVPTTATLHNHYKVDSCHDLEGTQKETQKQNPGGKVPRIHLKLRSAISCE